MRGVLLFFTVVPAVYGVGAPIETLVEFFDSGLSIPRSNPECRLKSPEHRLFGDVPFDPRRHIADSTDPGAVWNRTYVSGNTWPDPNNSSGIPSCCQVEEAIHVNGDNGLRPIEVLDPHGLNEQVCPFTTRRKAAATNPNHAVHVLWPILVVARQCA